MKYFLVELASNRDGDEALRSYERAEARGEIAECRGLLDLYAAGLALLYMRLALAEREGD
jgi:hypothetical protein